MNTIPIRKTLIASSVTLALGTPVAEAALVTNVLGAYTWSTDSGNFTALAPNGGVANAGFIPNYGFVGGSSSLQMSWDGNAYNSSTDFSGPGGATNINIVNCCSGSTVFFGHSWTAHDVQMFVPGSYSFDVALGGGNPETGTLNATVGSGQLGMHMLFDWNGNNNIDIFVVFAQNSIFGSGLLYSTVTNSNGQFTCDANFTGTITKNCLSAERYSYGSAGAPTKNEIWMLASVDGNGDGVMGIPMAAGGPFSGFSANYNFNLTATPKPSAVPVPATTWLFGSGLMGLVAAARRREKIASQQGMMSDQN